MSQRKLMSFCRLTDIETVPWLDRLVKAKVNGWSVLIPKNMYEENEIVVFAEPDTLLPVDDPRYGFLRNSCKVVEQSYKGLLIKVMNIHNVTTTGVVFKAKDFPECGEVVVGKDLTKILGIEKFDDTNIDLDISNRNFIGERDSRFTPESDADRVQTLSDHWDEIKSLVWTPSIKVDGSSMTIVNNNGRARFFNRRKEMSLTHYFAEVLTRQGWKDFIETQPDSFSVQLEFVGPKVQENKLKLSHHRGFAFACWYKRQIVDYPNWPEFVKENSVPRINIEFKDSLEETINSVDGIHSHVTQGCLDEGVVWQLRSDQTLPQWLPSHRCIKIINNAYLTKKK